jgi:hypothetical protein
MPSVDFETIGNDALENLLRINNLDGIPFSDSILGLIEKFASHLLQGTDLKFLTQKLLISDFDVQDADLRSRFFAIMKELGLKHLDLEISDEEEEVAAPIIPVYHPSRKISVEEESLGSEARSEDDQSSLEESEEEMSMHDSADEVLSEEEVDAPDLSRLNVNVEADGDGEVSADLRDFAVIKEEEPERLHTPSIVYSMRGSREPSVLSSSAGPSRIEYDINL